VIQRFTDLNLGDSSLLAGGKIAYIYFPLTPLTGSLKLLGCLPLFVDLTFCEWFVVFNYPYNLSVVFP